jgi:penicillin-binding protein 1A
VVQADGGQVFATRGVFKGEKLSAQELPRNLKDAIIAIEDRHFFAHGGFYLPSLFRAAFRNAMAGATREGGSTITQQLARMTYLSPERTIKRKVQEAIVALRLEHQLSKEEILTRYLNGAYFGAGVYGADAAAKRYFGKPAQELSLAEAAMLAGLVRAPSALAPTRNLEGARQRAALVLDAMVETGAVSAVDAEAARQHPATLRLPPEKCGQATAKGDRSIRSDALYPALSCEWEVPVTRNAKITPVNEGVGGGVGGPPLRDHLWQGPPLPVTLRLIHPPA